MVRGASNDGRSPAIDRCSRRPRPLRMRSRSYNRSRRTTDRHGRPRQSQWELVSWDLASHHRRRIPIGGNHANIHRGSGSTRDSDVSDDGGSRWTLWHRGSVVTGDMCQSLWFTDGNRSLQGVRHAVRQRECGGHLACHWRDDQLGRYAPGFGVARRFRHESRSRNLRHWLEGVRRFRGGDRRHRECPVGDHGWGPWLWGILRQQGRPSGAGQRLRLPGLNQGGSRVPVGLRRRRIAPPRVRAPHRRAWHLCILRSRLASGSRRSKRQGSSVRLQRLMGARAPETRTCPTGRGTTMRFRRRRPRSTSSEMAQCRSREPETARTRVISPPPSASSQLRRAR